uniref:Genetic suppressor element 1-like n=1 Tax=Sinocyclocheilus anshuiensis TaxID=1608454 RepID=A0A671QU23_9TELE
MYEPKSPSLGMISAAPCSMATVSPLAPSPISGAVVANGSPAAQSAHSGFAAALRKLAKQAEEPRGEHPFFAHHTPKRVAMGMSLGPPTGSPPVVTIAPTKTVNGFWRSEGRSGQERSAPDRPLPGQEKPSLSLPSYLGSAHPFSVAPSALVQDPRLQTHLSRQVPHMLLSGAQDEFVRDGFRPYTSADELRVPLGLPLGLSPGTAADALAYFHSGYLPHPSLASYRMEDYYSLSALRSHYYPHPEGATLPALHPSAVHLPMPGVFYPPDITHQSLSALHSERLQMEEELRQQQRERMREIERERQWEQEVQREKDREREKQRELEMTKERGRDIQAVKAVEKRHLSHEPPANTHSISQPHPYTHRQPAKERGKLEERLAANRADKTKETPLFTPQSGPYSSSGGPSSISTSGPGLSSSVHFGKSKRPTVSPMMLQRQEEDRWLGRQRVLKVERADRHGQEFQQQEPADQREIHRSKCSVCFRFGAGVRDIPPPLGAPPPLITPKPLPRDQHPSPPAPSSLWNPVSFLRSPSDRPLSHIHPYSGHSRPKPPEEDVRRVSGLSQQRPAFSQSDSRPPQGPVLDRTDPRMVYDQALQQHRRLVSKLDLEEKKRREAREKGYYYELDDSYDESDEEEVRAHLRRVTQQPPLKLDASTEKTEFLCLFGLTTLSKRDELLEMKKRKRRMMLQERVPSPSVVPNKRKTPSPPHPPLSTCFTPEEMDRTEELDDKKHFLSIFSLSHVSQEERQENKKIVDLLEAIKQKTVTLDTLRNATDTPCSSPAASSNLRNTTRDILLNVFCICIPTGGASEQFEPPALPPPGLQRAVNRLPNGQSNGHSCHISAQRESPGVRNDFSAEEGVSSDEDEEEESFGPRWRGIESIFEAYEEYMEEKSIEQQVLQSECIRLETQHYNLTLTAEQLSHSMRDLLAQKHNLALKRDRMQAELEHIKECLTLPLLHWHRGHYKRPSPR